MADKRGYIKGSTFTFKEIHRCIQRGDIVGWRGSPRRTKRGELSIVPYEIHILSMCFEQLPKSFFGVTDLDTRYRMRCLDLLVNEKSRQIFMQRSSIIQFIRTYLDTKGFIEVETPLLQNAVGGATAKPFVTYYNDLKRDMYLRVAPELYLKRLIAGGFDKVYEIGKQFRNETIDPSHNPEFTSMEMYASHWNYESLMDLMEEFLPALVHKLYGKLVIEYNGKELDFTPPYPRIDILDKIKEMCPDFDPPLPFTSEESKTYLEHFVDEHELTCPKPYTVPRMLNKIAERFVEDGLFNPTFRIHHPSIMSPLAKEHPTDKHKSQRFELFVGEMELCNAYSELNDPILQREKFMLQQADKATGDDEAMGIVEEFLRAMEMGLPPTGGLGIGIDRLVMLLTNQTSIKEVILFPHLKTIV